MPATHRIVVLAAPRSSDRERRRHERELDGAIEERALELIAGGARWLDAVAQAARELAVANDEAPAAP
jgi:hypothetical protein